MSEQLIPLVEVAEVTRRRVEDVRAEAVELDLMVRTDWAGRDALSVGDAAGLVSGSRRNVVEHQRAWDEHQREVAQWSAGARRRRTLGSGAA